MHTCVICRNQLTGRQRKYCSQACSITGWWNTRTANGTYNEDRKVEATCIICGTTWRSTTKRSKYCTQACQAKAEHHLEGVRRWGREKTRRHRTARKIKQTQRTTTGTTWVNGPCLRCGTGFTARVYSNDSPPRFCSARCRARHRDGIRDVRKRGAARMDKTISREAIFQRDKHSCHLCGKQVARTKVVPHPKAPVLDHVVPLAHGGDHTAANLRTAHFLCNSLKGTGGGGEQLALIG